MLSKLKKYEDDSNNVSKNIQIGIKSNINSSSVYKPIDQLDKSKISSPFL